MASLDLAPELYVGSDVYFPSSVKISIGVNQGSRCSLELKKPASSFLSVGENAILFSHDSVIFSGEITEISQGRSGLTSVSISGPSFLLSRKILSEDVLPLSFASFASLVYGLGIPICSSVLDVINPALKYAEVDSLKGRDLLSLFKSFLEKISHQTGSPFSVGWRESFSCSFPQIHLVKVPILDPILNPSSWDMLYFGDIFSKTFSESAVDVFSTVSFEEFRLSNISKTNLESYGKSFPPTESELEAYIFEIKRSVSFSRSSTFESVLFSSVYPGNVIELGGELFYVERLDSVFSGKGDVSFTVKTLGERNALSTLKKILK